VFKVLFTLLMLLVVSAFIVLPIQAQNASGIDFSQCEGWRGPALGMCKAGTAIGCLADNTGDPACIHITATFVTITGEQPPWASPVCVPNLTSEYQNCPVGTEPCMEATDCSTIPCTGTCGTADTCLNGVVCSQLTDSQSCETVIVGTSGSDQACTFIECFSDADCPSGTSCESTFRCSSPLPPPSP
jgi:hypothetical protein